MQTRIILTITHKNPIPDLTDKVAGRVWSLQGVEGVEAVLDDFVKFLDEEPKIDENCYHQLTEPAPSTAGERPTKPGLFAWVPESGSPVLVMVDKRPSDYSPGGVLNGHVLLSPTFYDGCAIASWPATGWVDLRAALLQSTALPERDHSKPAEAQGLFHKFNVTRVDGSDQPGGKHHGCAYFVLDVDHDPHAKPALQAYAVACAQSHPQLSEALIALHGTALPDHSEQHLDMVDALPVGELTHAQVDEVVYSCRQNGDDSTYAIVNAALAAARSQPVREPLTPWNSRQVERMYRNSPELHKDAKTLAAFTRVARAIERAHGITQP